MGVGDALLGGSKKVGGRRCWAVADMKLARIEMKGREGVRRCNDRAFYFPRTNRLQAPVEKGTGSQKGERLRASRLMRSRKQDKSTCLVKIL